MDMKSHMHQNHIKYFMCHYHFASFHLTTALLSFRIENIIYLWTKKNNGYEVPYASKPYQIFIYMWRSCDTNDSISKGLPYALRKDMSKMSFFLCKYK